jgi:diketogulonate reductase-like aldo/keto reductase
LETAINKALEIGYRHFDTAYFYKNEDVLGKVLKQWLDAGKIKRDELFITTKLPFHGNHPDRVEHFLLQSLKALQLPYVDLYLIHNPVGIKYVTDDEFVPKEANGDVAVDMGMDLIALWRGMEAQVTAGRTLSIGVSNFNGNQLERIVKVAKIHPVNNQVECNLYFQQKELREVCKRLDVTMVAYGPLGSPGRGAFYAKMGTTFTTPSLLDDPKVAQIATKHGKTPGQILLRFLIQLGVAAIPKSVTPARLKQNFEVREMRKILWSFQTIFSKIISDLLNNFIFYLDI